MVNKDLSGFVMIATLRQLSVKRSERSNHEISAIQLRYSQIGAKT